MVAKEKYWLRKNSNLDFPEKIDCFQDVERCNFFRNRQPSISTLFIMLIIRRLEGAECRFNMYVN